jgi:hypothetical protein
MLEMFPPEPQFHAFNLKPDPKIYIALRFNQEHLFLPKFVR